jgi:ATP-dependent protease ClpP protease subunit
MQTQNEFSLTVLEMGTHQAGLIYTGEMTQPGALALTRQFERLFGYYQYPKIVLSIESPGGALDGLEYVLRSMMKWSVIGKHVAVRSTFLCASAGAFLLAMGAWGERRVDKGTLLLFHNARIAGASVPQMTASMTTNISRTLSTVDRSLLDYLVEKFARDAGGAAQLARTVQMRLEFVDKQWANVGSKLATIASGKDGTRKPAWIKSMFNWAYDDPVRFMTTLKANLARSFGKDRAFDLAESFVLCLIDEIEDVLSDRMERTAAQVPLNAEHDTEGGVVFNQVQTGPGSRPHGHRGESAAMMNI